MPPCGPSHSAIRSSQSAIPSHRLEKRERNHQSPLLAFFRAVELLVLQFNADGPLVSRGLQDPQDIRPACQAMAGDCVPPCELAVTVRRLSERLLVHADVI